MPRRAAKTNAPASRSDRQASPTDFSRESSVERYATSRAKRKRKGTLKAFLITVAFLFVAMGGVALAYVNNISSQLNKGIDNALRGQLTEAQAGDPFYMLLMGVDKSESRTSGAESSHYGTDDSNFRADTIILARVDPAQKQVTLVSIHRDTLIDFGSDGGKQKINAAYSIGAAKEGSSGPAYMVQTVSKFAGVPISHYAEIDFDGFSAVVDQLGGVEVDVQIDVKDSYSGADLKKGVQTLNGEQALALCRSRHAYDNYGDGDVFRASNQRMVIGAIVQKILSSNVATISSTVSTLSRYITTDFSVTDILGYATQFVGFDPSTNMYSGMEPTNSKYVNSTWYEICDTEAWKTMMVRVNKGLSPYEDESQDVTKGYAGGGSAIRNEDGTTSTATTSSSTTSAGTVEVLNGAGVSGLAARVASTLSNFGFTTSADTADSFDYSTTRIIYVGDDNKDEADAVAEALGLGNVQADDGTYAGQAGVVVVLGADMAGN